MDTRPEALPIGSPCRAQTRAQRFAPVDACANLLIGDVVVDDDRDEAITVLAGTGAVVATHLCNLDTARDSNRRAYATCHGITA